MTQSGLIMTAQCLALGITSDQLSDAVRQGRWTRAARGVYDTGAVTLGPKDHDKRRLRAITLAQLAGGPDSIAIGLTALAIHGVWGVPSDLRPQVTLPHARSVRGPGGCVVRRFKPGQVVVVDGRRAVDVPTALVQALPEVSRSTGVALLDSAINKQRITHDDLPDLARRVAGRRGSVRWKDRWSLVDGRAESPPETWARLDCVDHGLPPDDLQVKVFRRDGRFVGRGDLGWRCGDGWVIAEIDGEEVHSELAALFTDRRRQNSLVKIPGVTVLRYTSVDRGGVIAADVREVLSESAHQRL